MNNLREFSPCFQFFEVAHGEINFNDSPENAKNSVQKNEKDQNLPSTSNQTPQNSGPWLHPQQEIESQDQLNKGSSAMDLESDSEKPQQMLEELNAFQQQSFEKPSEEYSIGDYLIKNPVENSELPETSNPKKISKQKIEKNDSKNVAKGMLKAFAHMILNKNSQNIQFLSSYSQTYDLDLEEYKNLAKWIRKSPKISITEIRDLMMKDKFAVHTRRLGFYFLRRKFLNHIFYSKMEKRQTHLKYLSKWKEVFMNPEDFKSLK